MINIRKFVIGLAVAVVGTLGIVGTVAAQRYQRVDPPCVADRPCLVDCPYRAPCPMYNAGQRPEMCYHYRYHCWDIMISTFQDIIDIDILNTEFLQQFSQT